jgi:hypothetical protein
MPSISKGAWAMQYDLWDIDTGNLHGNFATELDALKLVRVLVAAYGEAIVEDLQLGGRDDSGRPLTAIRGADLLERARAAVAV